MGRRGAATSGRAGDADVGVPAELIGHPARSTMLLALLDGRALPMSTLAGEAGIAASTASAHLSRMVDGGLLTTRAQGRHRYYEIASVDVAQALESLARLAPPRPVTSLRSGTRAHALRRARTCYDHVAGHLGVAIMSALLDRGVLAGGTGHHDPDTARADRLSAPGRDVTYRLTAPGREFVEDFLGGLPAGRRREVGYCVDWTEQRHHLAGALGAALLTRVEQLGWVERGERGVARALRVTRDGRAGFADTFGFDVATLPGEPAA